MFFSEIMEYVISHSENVLNKEVPIYSVVAIENNIISESSNRVEETDKPWMHAEYLAIKRACTLLQSRYLDNASIYVNLEPCAFCAAMLEKVRIKEIFFGAYDPKCGAIAHNVCLFEHSLIHPNIIGGIQEERCSRTISAFFKNLRNDV